MRPMKTKWEVSPQGRRLCDEKSKLSTVIWLSWPWYDWKNKKKVFQSPRWLNWSASLMDWLVCLRWKDLWLFFDNFITFFLLHSGLNRLNFSANIFPAQRIFFFDSRKKKKLKSNRTKKKKMNRSKFLLYCWANLAYL